MREAPEARDDRVVALRIIERSGESRIAREGGGEFHAQFLIGQILAVLEGQVDELPPRRGQRAIEAVPERGARRRPRLRVGGERPARPRKRLRGNWSNKRMSARQGSASLTQSAQPPAAARSRSGSNRSRHC